MYMFILVSHIHWKTHIWNEIHQNINSGYLKDSDCGRFIFYASPYLSNFLPWEKKFFLPKTKRKLKVWGEMYLATIDFVLTKKDG